MPRNDVERRCYAEFIRLRPHISDGAAAEVAALPEQQRGELGGYRLLCVHGSDRRIDKPAGFMRSEAELRGIAERIDADILLCAHTHTPFAASVNGRLILNVGSVGRPQDSPGPCYCLLRLGDALEYGFRKLRDHAE